MKIICGLGNPGREYEGNRHNIGFMVLDVLAQRWRVNFNNHKFDADLATANVAGDKVLLLKPQTFMNLSGTSLGAAARFYKVTAEDVLVVHDELDIPFARLALKQGGGSGGHNGLNSIRESWGEEQYARLRFGIGKPTGPNARERVVGHVLGDFSKEERDVLPELIGKSVDICESWTRDGLAKAMNRHNGK
ncbi:MAG: aminoacyl-tRNA hydrolase [Archangium gephyra]|uniref:Peptidyl-tRNA hydrolase n=1 Tax=Archangium gephyra TaxID=48 RepID=A0A2W5TSB8_9BACT|nr:MAG: aminoacyl-tRNA hydrolase [Archangium gephyra]